MRQLLLDAQLGKQRAGAPVVLRLEDANGNVVRRWGRGDVTGDSNGWFQVPGAVEIDDSFAGFVVWSIVGAGDVGREAIQPAPPSPVTAVENALNNMRAALAGLTERWQHEAATVGEMTQRELDAVRELISEQRQQLATVTEQRRQMMELTAMRAELGQVRARLHQMFGLSPAPTPPAAATDDKVRNTIGLTVQALDAFLLAVDKEQGQHEN